MDMYPQYQSRSGYFNQDDQTDGYGVDHSGFSLRDELLYQTARKEREQELFENFNRQGVDENYPRLGTGFWENSADNYGFGRSNIENNIKKRQFTPVPDTSIQNAAQKRAMMMPTQSGNDFAPSFETSDRVKRLYPETSPADPDDQNCSMIFNGSNLELLKDNKNFNGKGYKMNIQEIAIRTNFANQSSLGRFFRKHTGMSLSQYRMSHLD